MQKRPKLTIYAMVNFEYSNRQISSQIATSEYVTVLEKFNQLCGTGPYMQKNAIFGQIITVSSIIFKIQKHRNGAEDLCQS